VNRCILSQGYIDTYSIHWFFTIRQSFLVYDIYTCRFSCIVVCMLMGTMCLIPFESMSRTRKAYYGKFEKIAIHWSVLMLIYIEVNICCTFNLWLKEQKQTINRSKEFYLDSSWHVKVHRWIHTYFIQLCRVWLWRLWKNRLDIIECTTELFFDVLKRYAWEHVTLADVSLVNMMIDIVWEPVWNT
jgi:hypothetical protein